MIREKVYGSKVREFEALLSKHFLDAGTIVVNNATMGILGILYALDLHEAEIITTPFTWPGALAPLKLLKNKIVYAQIEEPTLTLNPDTLENFITPQTKAVFSADVLGYPCRLDEISRICKKHDLWLIHDAAASMGTSYKNYYSGYYADVSVYSFGRNKPFSTGEGGVVITNNNEIYENLILTITHPERQIIELQSYYSFSINMSLNPLAVHYGLKNFHSQLDKIYFHRDKVYKYFNSKNINEFYPEGIFPNFYKPFAYKTNIKGLKTLDLPFVSLSEYTGIAPRVLNSYKIAESFCLFRNYTI